MSWADFAVIMLMQVVQYVHLSIFKVYTPLLPVTSSIASNPTVDAYKAKCSSAYSLHKTYLSCNEWLPIACAFTSIDLRTIYH